MTIDEARDALLDGAAEVIEHGWPDAPVGKGLTEVTLPAPMLYGARSVPGGWVEWDRADVTVHAGPIEVVRPWPWVLQALWERENLTSLF